MKQVVEFLENAASIFIFCIAVTVLLISFNHLSKLVTVSKLNLSDGNVLYEQALEKIEVEKVTYAELISTLMGEVETDIQINQLLIIKDDYNYATYDFSQIPKTMFNKEYVFDSTGKIIKVIFSS